MQLRGHEADFESGPLQGAVLLSCDRQPRLKHIEPDPLGEPAKRQGAGDGFVGRDTHRNTRFAGADHLHERRNGQIKEEEALDPTREREFADARFDAFFLDVQNHKGVLVRGQPHLKIEGIGQGIVVHNEPIAVGVDVHLNAALDRRRPQPVDGVDAVCNPEWDIHRRLSLKRRRSATVYATVRRDNLSLLASDALCPKPAVRVPKSTGMRCTWSPPAIAR